MNDECKMDKVNNRIMLQVHVFVIYGMIWCSSASFLQCKKLYGKNQPLLSFTSCVIFLLRFDNN